jgi:hypothetical protein
MLLILLEVKTPTLMKSTPLTIPPPIFRIYLSEQSRQQTQVTLAADGRDTAESRSRAAYRGTAYGKTSD